MNDGRGAASPGRARVAAWVGYPALGTLIEQPGSRVPGSSCPPRRRRWMDACETTRQARYTTRDQPAGVQAEAARVLAGLRSGDGPLSVRVRPSSLKRNCDRRTTSTGEKVPGERIREVTLDPGVSADPAGLTARARPEARPRMRAANLGTHQDDRTESVTDTIKGTARRGTRAAPLRQAEPNRGSGHAHSGASARV